MIGRRQRSASAALGTAPSFPKHPSCAGTSIERAFFSNHLPSLPPVRKNQPAQRIIGMSHDRGRLPLPIKLVFTTYMALHVPEYLLNYGPTNFLYFCDVALVLTFVGVWLENSLLISMCCVGILLLQGLWLIDLFSHLLGHPLTPVTDYMFDPGIPLLLRLLSLFHGWLPILLVYLVWRRGYDRRAFWSWTLLAWALLLICFFLMPAPAPNPGLRPVNINYVFGLSDQAPQHWMPPYAWLGLLMVGLPLLVFAPVHLLLQRVVPKRSW
jgi:hypothetical protein